MKQLKDLKQNHRDILNKVRDIQTLSDKENRDLSTAENKEIDELFSKGEALKKDIERREKIKALEIADSNKDRPWENEKRQYSLKNALCILAGIKSVDTGYEREVSEELDKRATRKTSGVMVPALDMWKKKVETRVVNAQSALIQTTVKASEYVSALYEKTILDMLGVRRVSADGNYSFPRSSGVTAGWFSADGGSDSEDDITESDPTFTSVSQTPHYLAVMSGYTLAQIKSMMSNISLEALLREDLSMAMADQLNDSFLNGTNANQQPQGLLGLVTANTSHNWKDSDTADKFPLLADLLAGIKALKTAYKNNGMAAKWLFSVGDEEILKGTKVLENDAGKVLWENNQVAGLPAVATGHLEDNALVGDFSQAIVSEFGAVSLELGMIDSDFKKSIQRIRAIGCYDFAVRRTEAFQKFTLTRT